LLQQLLPLQPVGRELPVPAHGALPKMGEISGGIVANCRSKQDTPYLPQVNGYHTENNGQYGIAANDGYTT
jgi:hypothetical protein